MSCCCGVTTTCCANTLPTTLHASCNLGAGTVVLTWDGSTYWTGTAHPTCGDTLKLRVHCAGGDISQLLMEGSCNGGSTWFPVGGPDITSTCSPLSSNYSGTLAAGNGCTGCDLQNFTATVTV